MQLIIMGPKPGCGIQHVILRNHSKLAWVFSKRSIWKNFPILEQGSHQEVDPLLRYFNQDSAVLNIYEYVRSRKKGSWNEIWTVKYISYSPWHRECVEENFHELQYVWAEARGRIIMKEPSKTYRPKTASHLYVYF